MWKFITAAWNLICFVWTYVKPILSQTRHIFDDIKAKGLKDCEARKETFQHMTDLLHSKGLKDVPDSVLNCTIELCYQIYLWENKKGETK